MFGGVRLSIGVVSLACHWSVRPVLSSILRNGLDTALVRPWYGVGISLVGWGFFCGAISPPTVACWGVQTDAFWREMLSSVCKLCFAFSLFVYLFLGSKDKHFLAIFIPQISRLFHTCVALTPHKCPACSTLDRLTLHKVWSKPSF